MKDILDDALLLDPPGGGRLCLRFAGRFEGEEVLWDACLMTRAEWQHLHPEERGIRNFIEIGDMGGDGHRLRVVLDVERIDLPTVRKAMLMIRQYKRLRRGRHDFG